MQIGLYLSWEAELPATTLRRIDDAFAEVRLAESLGYDSVLIAEPSIDCQTNGLSAAEIVRRYLAETDSIRLGTADRVLALEQPDEVADDYSALFEISNGRLICGVAVGEDEEPFFERGIPFEQCHKRFNTALGRLCNLPSAPTIWLTARDFPTVSTAARIRRPILPYPLSEHQVAIELYEEYDRRLVDEYGEDQVLERPIVRDIFVAETNELAFFRAMPHFQHMYERHAGACELLDDRNQPKMPEQCSAANLREHHLVIGDPASVAGQLLTLQRQTRTNHLLCRMAVDGMAQADVLRSIELFAREVAPSVQLQ